VEAARLANDSNGLDGDGLVRIEMLQNPLTCFRLLPEKFAQTPVEHTQSLLGNVRGVTHKRFTADIIVNIINFF